MEIFGPECSSFHIIWFTNTTRTTNTEEIGALLIIIFFPNRLHMKTYWHSGSGILIIQPDNWRRASFLQHLWCRSLLRPKILDILLMGIQFGFNSGKLQFEAIKSLDDPLHLRSIEG